MVDPLQSDWGPWLQSKAAEPAKAKEHIQRTTMHAVSCCGSLYLLIPPSDTVSLRAFSIHALHSYSPYPMLPLIESGISTGSAPMLPLMIASAFPLPAQLRRMHPMQASQAKTHQMSPHSSQRRSFVCRFCTTENINNSLRPRLLIHF